MRTTIDPPLGELRSVRSSWRPGNQGATPPNAIVVGDVQQLTLGATQSLQSIGGELQNGYDSRCFVTQAVAPTFTIDDFDVDDPCSGFDLAGLVALAYSDLGLLAAELLLVIGGTGTVVTRPTTVLQSPACGFAWNNNFAIGVISGTTDFLDLALQATELLGPMTDFGTYSTIPFWRSATDDTNNFAFVSGLPADRPILLIGHSFGGVVALLLAVMYKTFQPARDVRLVTFGMPMVGDQRLRELSGLLEARHWCNTDDAVPLCPPQGSSAASLIPGIGLALVELWGHYKPAFSRVGITPFPAMVPVDPRSIDFVFLSQLLAWLLGGPLPLLPSHSITAYQARLNSLCNVI